MTEKQKFISDDEFRIVFSYERVREILLTDIVSYPLICPFINYFISNKLYKKREHFPSKKHRGFVNFNNIFGFLKASLFYIKSLEKSETLKTGLDILFFSRDRFIEINTENDSIKSDYLFWSVIRDINRKYPAYKMALVSMTYKSMPKIDDIRLYNLIQYSTPMIFLRSVLFSTSIYLRWKLSRSKMITYLKDNECEYAVPLFDDFFNPIRLFSFLVYNYSLQNVLKKTKPRVIMANDDILLLKPNNLEKNTKFIIMQSASIDEMNEKYKRMFLSMFPLDKLIADYFLVSGIKLKDMKKDTGSKEIMVTGQPRYDILYYADKIYSKDKFLSKYEINPTHKIILWATAFHVQNHEENIRNFEVVFETMQNIKNATLIIKQHPSEEEKYTKMIRNYSNKYKINAIITPKNSDTHEQLFACDLMIIKDSTTAMEAVVLDKPVVVLNLSGETDAVDYVEQGVALGVYNENDLKHVIEKLLKHDIDLAKSRKRYIEKYLCKADGKATERVVDLIVQMIEESKRAKVSKAF